MLSKLRQRPQTPQMGISRSVRLRSRETNTISNVAFYHPRVSNLTFVAPPVIHAILQNASPKFSRGTPLCSAAPRQPRVLIEYCPGCRWGLRAGWVAQELLVTFESDLGEVAMRPSASSGVFDVWVGDTRVWSRAEAGRFPELKEVKRAVRDLIQPDKSLGHSDRST